MGIILENDTAKKENAIDSGKASDKKKLPPGDRKFIIY